MFATILILASIPVGGYYFGQLIGEVIGLVREMRKN